jgi:protein-S-isoprenylcysteine O-methyltransferase Ste14
MAHCSTYDGGLRRLHCPEADVEMLIVMHRDPDFLRLDFLNSYYAQLVGWVLLGIGFAFWGVSAVVFLTDFRKGILVVRGPYALCRNPIYAAWIVFVIPAFGLMFQSRMILSMDCVLYLNCRLSIHGEQRVLQRTFGEAYARYEKSVNEIAPFPKFSKDIR